MAAIGCSPCPPFGSLILPAPNAFFNSRVGLNIIDSIAGEQINVKSFPVCNYYSSIGAGWYTNIETFESPITVAGDWSAVMICRNENSDAVYSAPDFRQLNGNNEGIYLYNRSGGLYVAAQITYNNSLGFNGVGKVVTQAEPWVLAMTFDSATDTGYVILNGTQIDTGVAAALRLGVAAGQLNWRGFNNLTNIRIFGIWIFDRRLTNAEIGTIHSTGVFPADVPSRQYVHLNFEDIVSQKMFGSHNRKCATFLNNGANSLPPDIATMWTSRYDNAAFAYSLFNGYTGFGNFKIPYSPTGAKMMANATGDIEFPSTNCLHNMTESRLYFDTIANATIKAIFDKSNATYWLPAIALQPHYIDAGGGYYGVWHPSQLTRNFINTYAQPTHRNHIFASLRTSGQCITGITALRVYENNLS